MTVYLQIKKMMSPTDKLFERRKNWAFDALSPSSWSRFNKLSFYLPLFYFTISSVVSLIRGKSCVAKREILGRWEIGASYTRAAAAASEREGEGGAAFKGPEEANYPWLNRALPLLLFSPKRSPSSPFRGRHLADFFPHLKSSFGPYPWPCMPVFW